MTCIARKVFIVVATAMVVAACASAAIPVRNYHAVPITAKSNPSLEQIGKAIVAGSVAAGWQANEVKPGAIVATYRIRSHLAVVDIAYNTKSYDITFKEGDAGLKYDGQNIHQNYNSWAENLERVIRVHLNAL